MIRQILSLACLFALSVPVSAQIEMKDTYVMGEPIVLRFKVEGVDAANVAVDYKFSKGQQSTASVTGPLDRNIWVTAPGEYRVDASGAAIKDGKPVAKWFDHTYTVKPAGDGPIPEAPATLRSLVSDAEAKKLVEILTPQLDQMKAGQFRDLAMWKTICEQRIKANGIDNAKAVARLFAMNADFAKLAQSLEATIKELGGTTTTPADPPNIVTAITYVHEQREGSVPPAVMAVIDKLKRQRGILATAFDKDTKDADGDVPEQYKVALAAAIEAGLPAAVALNGRAVVKVISRPTAEQMWSLAP